MCCDVYTWSIVDLISLTYHIFFLYINHDELFCYVHSVQSLDKEKIYFCYIAQFIPFMLIYLCCDFNVSFTLFTYELGLCMILITTVDFTSIKAKGNIVCNNQFLFLPQSFFVISGIRLKYIHVFCLIFIGR